MARVVESCVVDGLGGAACVADSGGWLDVCVCCDAVGHVLEGCCAVLEGSHVCCGVLEGVQDCCGVLEGVQVCCGDVLETAVVETAVQVCCGDVLETAVVETAVQVCSVVVEAGVGGTKDGVVTVHLLQVVTVSVVRNVDVLVIISMDVLPPLWWVFVETGQLVTVV